MGDYSDHYLKIDVTLLSDIFEKFRDICYGIYKIDPLRFYSVPGLRWQAMLRSTAVKLELILDYNMYLFIEDGIRGGFCGGSQYTLYESQ